MAIGRRCHVAFKARLADLITCSDRAWDDGFGHMIARQHVDFVLCDYRIGAFDDADAANHVDVLDRQAEQPVERLNQVDVD